MCLVVFAPLISQMTVSRSSADPDAAICSATSPGHGADVSPAGTTLSACGYCNFLATPSAPPPVILPAPGWIPLFIAVVTVPALRVEFPLLSHLAGYPRAPPSPV